MMENNLDYIILEGMCQNNLKNLSLKIPKNKITIFTGVSGSGKSSIVFDTIGNESMRQMNQTQSTFIQNFLPKYEKPKVSKIENLSPAIIIDQSRLGGNIRSTLGTITDIYSFIRVLYSRFGIPHIGQSNLFSFNDPEGMCPDCAGIGRKIAPHVERIIDMSKSLNDGAIRFPIFSVDSWYWKPYEESGFYDMNLPLNEYPPKLLDKLLYSESVRIKAIYKGREIEVDHEGVMVKFRRLYIDKDLSKQSEKTREKVEAFLTWSVCPTCLGKRLNQKSLSVKLQGKTIDQVVDLELTELLDFVQTMTTEESAPLVEEIIKRVKNLLEMNLGYLSLSRQTPTLSGGEAQRIKVVGHLNNSLNGLVYIFDEPSTGLHPRDLTFLTHTLQKLRDKGNTILVVEHDPDIIKIADFIVDVGPEAGNRGGYITFRGTFPELIESDTRTGRAFRKNHVFKNAPRKAQGYYEMKQAKSNNLKNIDVRIPKGVLTVITGVAGSGKSSLIFDEFLPQNLDAIVIDQSAVHRSSRSNIATYTDISNHIRTIFAKENSVDKALFSFNSQGACVKCKGKGVIEFNLAFMDDVKVECNQCHGKKYRPEVLKYLLKGKNIVEILDMTIEEAITFFDDKKITKTLMSLREVGVGYLTLGQSVTTLSGGECQRIKLASELHKSGALYILDEPTTGLHMANVEQLLEILNRLVDNGSTVVVIEHNTEIMKQADWMIDLGPEAGKNGGTIVFEGIPQESLQSEQSITGKILKTAL